MLEAKERQLVNYCQGRESLCLDTKVVSSWKGPELERVSKVRLLFRSSELTLEPGWGLQMPLYK
jgi:hypothetical protein